MQFLDDTKRPLKRLLTVPEAIFTYGIGRSKFYLEVAAGRIRLRKCGRRTLVSADDMEVWVAGLPVIERKPHTATTPPSKT
jgi:hypothetical protein